MGLIRTISGEEHYLDYTLVDKRYENHDGVIVDVGCLGWEWCRIFLGNKRVIGIDPQGYPIENTEFFKGILGPFDGIARLEEQKLDNFGTGVDGNFGSPAKVSGNNEGDLFDVISWKSLCKKFNIDQVSILKINIEGMEYPLLNSMDVNDYSKIDQIAISFHDFWYPEQKLLAQSSIKLLESVGFTVTSIWPQWGWWLAVSKK